MPGTPVLRYGDEIGMGEDLVAARADAIRTPMQWSGTANGGFSEAPTDRLIRPVVSAPPFGFQDVNVTDQRLEPDSMLSWFERMLHTLRECDEIGSGTHRVIDGTPPCGARPRRRGPDGRRALRAQPLRGVPQVVTPTACPTRTSRPSRSSPTTPTTGEVDPAKLEVGPYGFRWIRLRRSHGPAPG